MTESPAQAQDNLNSVEDRIAAAAREGGRKAATVTLIAVSKTFDPEAIEPVLATGHRHYGENRVQEALNKWPDLKRRFPDSVLHLIGPLQSNKVAQAVSLFDAIHSVDRDKLARALSRAIGEQGRDPLLFVQVNTGNEPQKAGVAPDAAASFVDRCRNEHGLAIQGLMCLPPFGEAAGPHFALLRQLAAQAEVPLLSMGMSADFETAIAMGATHVRVGSAIFGPR